MIELVVRARGGPDGLAQEAGGKADAQLVDFVGLLIDARGAARLLEDEGSQLLPLRGGQRREVDMPVLEVGVEDA